jgi:hypothetical protein
MFDHLFFLVYTFPAVLRRRDFIFTGSILDDYSILTTTGPVT